MTDETKKAWKHIGRTLTFHVKGKTKIGAKYVAGWCKNVGKAMATNPNKEEK